MVAIGDSGNDAEMLKMARYSFAMGNAAENIKQIARYATDDNNHEGALNVIQAVLDNTSPLTADLSTGAMRSGFPSFTSCTSHQIIKLALTYL